MSALWNGHNHETLCPRPGNSDLPASTTADNNYQESFSSPAQDIVEVNELEIDRTPERFTSAQPDPEPVAPVETAHIALPDNQSQPQPSATQPTSLTARQRLQNAPDRDKWPTWLVDALQRVSALPEMPVYFSHLMVYLVQFERNLGFIQNTSVRRCSLVCCC